MERLRRPSHLPTYPTAGSQAQMAGISRPIRCAVRFFERQLPLPLAAHEPHTADPRLWNRLSGLVPGQAIASFPHKARPLLVAIDAAPTELRLIE